ncbi:MAG: sulfite exporter TauE/SafE family protein [Lachnospiraceae bacterium]|nr:sulfite exporter TauE/SafE family protein [Lachnospiraceae bacterium]
MLWIIATFAAFYIKGLCGFANTLVFTSIMGFGAANVDISPVELILGYPSNMILTFRNRKLLKAKILLLLSALVVLGSIPGALLLKNTDVRYLKIVSGAVVLLIGIEMLLREYNIGKLKESKPLLYAIGVLSGVLCGLFGIGALLAAYVGRVTETGDEFKANISAVFIVDNTFRIVLYSLLGVITPDSVKQAALLLPVMLVGLFAGIKSAKYLDEKTVRKLVIVLLIVSGAVLVIKNL